MSRRDAQLKRLAEADYQRLWRRVRDKLERQSLALSGAVGLSNPSPEEHRALEGLMGRRLSNKRPTIKLNELDQRLKQGPCQEGLIAVLSHLGGPLRDKPKAQRALNQSLQALRESIHSSTLGPLPWTEPWLQHLESSGALMKLAKDGTQRDLHLAILTLERLHASPPWSGHIATLGAEINGDTKLLNPGPVTTLVLGALATSFQVPRPQNAAQRRALWERVGVIQDDLASHVLLLGLQAQGDSPLSRWLELGAKEGEPLRITLSQLTRYGLTPRKRRIYACENPAIIRRAALDLGPASPPLICTEGQPGAAFRIIANRVRDLAIPLYYHGDFDWPGVAIAGDIITRYNAHPWRMGAEDYIEALEKLGVAGTQPLDKKSPIPTPWDPDLRAAMERDDRAIFEEALMEELMLDLRG